MKIDEIKIDLNTKVFIIAELSANHNGSIDTAFETIKAAKRAGADAIKLQTYTADTLTLNSNSKDFVINSGSIWDGSTFYKLYQEAYTPWEWHAQLFEAAKAEGLVCFSSPFDFSSVDLLEELNTPAYKIASFEITDIPLIEYVASKGKPIIISTGIAEIEDIELALDACHRMGNNDIALLKCTSSYPAPIAEANMIMVKDLRERYGVITGLSDHTMGITVPIVATVFGAKIIEKHFILDRSIGGPDASFSLNEQEFTEMVKAIREAEKAVGEVNYTLTDKQAKGREFSRSLYISNDIKAGEKFTQENVRSVRPGFGLHPKYYNDILGKTCKKDCEKGTRLTLDLVC
jgi:pseudaminic acid synthase